MRNGEVAAWVIPANDEPSLEVRIGLPADFPAAPPTVSLPKSQHLQTPHVEVDGRVCHGVAAQPDGLHYLLGVLDQVRYVVGRSANDDWRETEFHRERASYWIWFCYQRKRRLGALKTVTSVRMTQSGLRGEVCVVSVGEQAYVGSAVAPLQLFIRRHGYSGGTERHGSALVVPLPAEHKWTPSSWPTDFPSVAALVDASGMSREWIAWTASLPRQRSSLALVIFGIGSTLFAYQVLPAAVPRLMAPSVEPVWTERRDVQWCLTRDHDAQELTARIKQRVVVLGCGSLGSRLASHLARAGVGHIDLVDSDIFDAENVSRHLLGMADVGQPKASALAARLRQDVPGVDVRGYEKDAVAWLRQQDLSNIALVVDATGDQGVRLGVRQAAAGTPLVIAWAEPLCAASHVVVLPDAALWPQEDPVDTRINAFDWSEAREVKLPACGAGFHPYADADMAQVAGMCAETVLGLLRSSVVDAHVVSQVNVATAARPSRLPLAEGVEVARIKRSWNELSV